MRARAVPAFYRQPQLLGLLLAFLSPIALAEPAGQILFVSGGGIAVDSEGTTRTLEKNGSLDEGDTILTKDGLVQIRFKDGAFLALQPRTEFKVERYRYAAAGDSEDGVVMSLLKGGLRTISGLVGKRDRNAYSMKAAVATIGIRGTDYALELNDKLVGNVSDGAIEVCNGAGCVGVLAGQAFLVPSLIEIPVLSERHVFLPPEQPRKTGRPADERKAAAGEKPAVDATAVGRSGNRLPSGRRAKGDASLESVLVLPAADKTPIAGPDKSVLSLDRGTALGAGLKPMEALAVPPGQERKPGVGDMPLVLPAPASSQSAPPGRLEKLDSGALDAIRTNLRNSIGLPPGEAKR
jgi:hypothetical protein